MMLGHKITKHGTPIEDARQEKQTFGHVAVSHMSPEEIAVYLADKYPRTMKIHSVASGC